MHRVGQQRYEFAASLVDGYSIAALHAAKAFATLSLETTATPLQRLTFNSLTPGGKELLAQERVRHRAALLAHLNTKKEVLDEKLNYIIQIEHIMANIEAVSNFMDKEIQFLSVFGILDMNRTLIKDCHVNKYNFNLIPQVSN
ncbi:unnamed protein product [Haemonchus placei]|uniref:HTH lysR-type domain-containing protein n=1 Tax=Haemonchus placei TaxID=6290 RepID=A0A158QPU9_HAEPC|nr:unnamed protein product [Haemonchus placei]